MLQTSSAEEDLGTLKLSSLSLPKVRELLDEQLIACIRVQGKRGLEEIFAKLDLYQLSLVAESFPELAKELNFKEREDFLYLGEMTAEEARDRRWDDTFGEYLEGLSSTDIDEFIAASPGSVLEYLEFMPQVTNEQFRALVFADPLAAARGAAWVISDELWEELQQLRLSFEWMEDGVEVEHITDMEADKYAKTRPHLENYFALRYPRKKKDKKARKTPKSPKKGSKVSRNPFSG